MRKTAHTGLALVVALALTIAAVLTAPRSHGTVPAGADGASAANVARIRAHLERVERVVRTRDISHLSPEECAARSRHLDALREYRGAGGLPRDPAASGRHIPDHHGTLCAVG